MAFTLKLGYRDVSPVIDSAYRIAERDGVKLTHKIASGTMISGVEFTVHGSVKKERDLLLALLPVAEGIARKSVDRSLLVRVEWLPFAFGAGMLALAILERIL